MARTTKLERDLRRAFPNVDDEGIKLALRLMRSQVEKLELDSLPGARDRVVECYHYPSHTDRTMHALNALLGTHGVEALGDVHPLDGPPFEYLNVGDPYVATVVWYRSSGRYYVRRYGDIVEAYRLK